MIVPNLFPTQPSSRRIAIIGEAPGDDEVRVGQPFVGYSGQLLSRTLSKYGVSREAVFLGNVCQHHPEKNRIFLFDWNGLQIQHGLTELEKDLESYQPNVIILLGNIPLKAAKDWTSLHPLQPKRFAYKVSNWRGSLFAGGGPFHGRKCLATYHPAYCLHNYEATPLFDFDIKKAISESWSADLKTTQRCLNTTLTNPEIVARIKQLRSSRPLISIDIEGGIGTMSCISIAPSGTDSFIVPFFHKDGSYVSDAFVWQQLALLLEDSAVPKVLQNSLYDRFVLHYSYGIRVKGVVDDTMLKHWELYSELEKSLAVQASIYTDEPYYKGERKSQNDTAFYEYCCRDSAITWEINNKLEKMLPASSRKHYKLNIELLNPLLYMEMRGIRYDVQGAAARRKTLLNACHESQARLNGLSGRGFKWTSRNEITNAAIALMGFKKQNYFSVRQLVGNCLKSLFEDAARLQQLLTTPAPSLAVMGEIENLCGVSLNVGSSKQFIPYLYEELQLPVKYKAQPRGSTEPPAPTADYEALLNLSKDCQRVPNDPRLPIIHTAIEIRALETRAQMLAISADKDRRIRCGYNIVGSNTGRITCYESPTGSGYNLQTIPNYHSKTEAPGGILGDRDLFLADEDHWFFQCDLSGADGWTVAAYSAMLGDSTMLDDYQAGLKPANVLCLILRSLATAHSPRQHFIDHAKAKTVKKEDWDYFACKRVQHGCSYLEGGLTVSRNILKDSEGKLYMSTTECEQLKQAFFTRYPGIQQWHKWVASRLKERPFLTAASGQVRQFFGRPDEILTKAVAYEPQANTTYTTNLAMHRLWTDQENRTRFCESNERIVKQSKSLLGQEGLRQGMEKRSGLYDGNEQVLRTLRIEPLHQVHDALCGQFAQSDTAWATGKIQSYFANEIVIAGQRIVIPFDGGYGRSWGELTEGKI